MSELQHCISQLLASGVEFTLEYTADKYVLRTSRSSTNRVFGKRGGSGVVCGSKGGVVAGSRPGASFGEQLRVEVVDNKSVGCGASERELRARVVTPGGLGIVSAGQDLTGCAYSSSVVDKDSSRGITDQLCVHEHSGERGAHELNGDTLVSERTLRNRRERERKRERKVRKQTAASSVRAVDASSEVPVWRRRAGSPSGEISGFWNSCSEEMRKNLIDSKARMHVAENLRKEREALSKVARIDASAEKSKRIKGNGNDEVSQPDKEIVSPELYSLRKRVQSLDERNQKLEMENASMMAMKARYRAIEKDCAEGKETIKLLRGFYGNSYDE